MAARAQRTFKGLFFSVLGIDGNYWDGASGQSGAPARLSRFLGRGKAAGGRAVPRPGSRVFPGAVGPRPSQSPPSSSQLRHRLIPG